MFAVTVLDDEVYVDFTNVLNGAEAPNFSSLAVASRQLAQEALSAQTRSAGGHGAEENKMVMFDS